MITATKTEVGHQDRQEAGQGAEEIREAAEKDREENAEDVEEEYAHPAAAVLAN